MSGSKLELDVDLSVTRGMSYYGLAIKTHLKAKEEIWKLTYFTMQKYINLQEIL
jgi:glucan biosynthesis protein